MACYITEGPKDTTPRGVVKVSWRVEPAGSVSDAKIVESTLGDEHVQSCILRQVQSWRFPSSGAAWEAVFPFAF
jgi:TonB family protein